MFSSGSANAALAVASMCQTLQHDVFLINSSRNNKTWWNDGLAMQMQWAGRIMQITDTFPKFDLVFEIDAQNLTVIERQGIAARSIWITRHSALIHEIETAIYPVSPSGYSLEGLSEVWMWDLNSTDDDVQIMETLTGLPCKRVPFLWTDRIAQCFHKVYNIRSWLETTAIFLLKQDGLVSDWKLHIAESNRGSHSSCVLPLVIAREARAREGLNIKRWTVHNCEAIIKSGFFHRNIIKNCVLEDLSGDFLGRYRTIDWALEPMSLVISHVRFERIRPFLLDLIWFGIPVVHNSPALADLSGGWSEMYYPDNEIRAAVTALKQMQENLINMSGIFTKQSTDHVRADISARFTPASPRLQTAWSELLSASIAVPKPVTLTSWREINIRFCDFWSEFNPEYNFFTLMLEDALAKQGCRSVINTQSEKPDLVIFGPFGETWRQWPGVPKVFFTGENRPSVQEESVKLNLTFERSGGVNQIRFPLWMLEIDWFRADVGRLRNPKPVPLDWCTQVRAADVARRTKFCAFVVSNPRNEFRNAAFHWLSKYKKIDSPGSLFNNLGNVIPAGMGGGGGELAKVEFLRDYKFCLVFENESAEGYTTEKLLHAKAAGCIPIYWGDPTVELDFDLAGCIDARAIKNKEDLIKLVRAVDENDSEWLRRYSVPALNSEKVERAQSTISEISRRILGLALPPPPAQPLALPPPPAQPQPHRILMTSFVSQKFVHCIPIWLKGILAQQVIKTRIYIASDVTDMSLEGLSRSYPTTEFIRIPEAVPEGAWEDYWKPQHYAWKLWLYKTLVTDPTLVDFQILYTDIGTFLSRWPTAWAAAAREEGISFLIDKNVINRDWCHDTFMSALSVTEEEKSANQVLGGLVYFVSGSPKATTVFKNAYELSLRRELVVGNKWHIDQITGQRLFHGHRHDQSILSILALRHKVAGYPYENVVCTTSLRKTFQSGASIYLHRGNFKIHQQPYDGIDDVYLINLKRRNDRLERFSRAHPDLAALVNVKEAVDGCQLKMSPELAKLFAPNDFGWKKSVMGCALSHYDVWSRLANDQPDINTYLILEDDVVMAKDWKEKWQAAMNAEQVPEDADVIFLGGILPPNRSAFEALKEPVGSSSFCKMGVNNLYGQTPPNTYIHSCAYAYILTKAGAKKVMNEINSHGGIWTSADHVLCNPVDTMNIYFFNPLIASCYQEEDPRYKAADFNNFHRIDNFDSDLWNNDERFPVPAAPVPAQPALQAPRRRYVCTIEESLIFEKLYEKNWLLYLLGEDAIDIAPVTQLEQDDVIFVMSHFMALDKLLQNATQRGIQCVVIHMSDEDLQHPLDFYRSPAVKNVIRFYTRETPMPEKVLTIPLGYHRRPGAGTAPPVESRMLDLSFSGTGWKGRREMLTPLFNAMPKSKCKFLETWEDTNQLTQAQYILELQNSIFVPCPDGMNPETFRFYEALECGAIPLIIGTEQNVRFQEFLTMAPLSVIAIKDWVHVKEFITELLSRRDLLEGYRSQILREWYAWKVATAARVRALLKA